MALGLEGEATASTRTGGDWGGNSFAAPIGWSGGYMGDFRPTPGHTPVASGTPGGYSDSVRRAGGYVSASDKGTGTSGGHFGAPTRWSEGPCGSPQDEWCQCSTPHGSPPNASFAPPSPREFAAGIPCPPLTPRPQYESSRLAFPYTPDSGGGVLLEFEHPPPPRFCATTGVRVPSACGGAPISQAVLPEVDMYDSICLPQAQGSSTPQPTQGYRSAGLSRCLIYSTGPLHHPPLPQLLGARDLAPNVLICSFSLRVPLLLGKTQPPPPRRGGGLLPTPTSTFLNLCTLLPVCPLPPVKVTHTSSPTTARVHIPILMVPPGILRGTSKVSTLPHRLLIWEGKGRG